MVEHFDKTRKFADQKTPAGHSHSNTAGDTRLPGPHYILEKAFQGTVEEEMRSKAGDAAAADRWFRTPQPSSEPIAYPLPEGGFDIEYGPPGLPIFLAQARGVSIAATEIAETQPNMYDAANDLLSMSNKMVPMPDYGMMPNANHQLLAQEGIPLMHMDGAADSALFHPAPHPQFLPPQQGMFLDGYAGQYTDGQTDSTYMQQTNFG